MMHKLIDKHYDQVRPCNMLNSALSTIHRQAYDQPIRETEGVPDIVQCVAHCKGLRLWVILIFTGEIMYICDDYVLARWDGDPLLVQQAITEWAEETHLSYFEVAKEKTEEILEKIMAH